MCILRNSSFTGTCMVDTPQSKINNERIRKHAVIYQRKMATCWYGEIIYKETFV